MPDKVECPICGKELSSLFYLGQHVFKKDDSAHNGEKAEIVEETVKEKEQGDQNIVEDWKDNNEDDNMSETTVNEVPVPEQEEQEDEYIDIGGLDTENLTDKQVKAFKLMMDKGYSQVEKDFNSKDLEEVDFK